MKKVLVVLSLFCTLSHADFYQVDKELREALSLGVDVSTFKQSLKEKGLDINVKEDQIGNTVLHQVLITSGEDFKLEEVQFLVEAGADPSATNNNESTPLHFATDFKCAGKSEDRLNDYKEMIKLLVKEGNEDSIDFTGQSPFLKVEINGCMDEELRGFFLIEAANISVEVGECLCNNWGECYCDTSSSEELEKNSSQSEPDSSSVNPGECVCNLNEESASSLDPGECVCDTSPYETEEEDSSQYKMLPEFNQKAEMGLEDLIEKVIKEEEQKITSEEFFALAEGLSRGYEIYQSDTTFLPPAEEEPSQEVDSQERITSEDFFKLADVLNQGYQITQPKATPSEEKTSEQPKLDVIDSTEVEGGPVQLEFFVQDFPSLFDQLGNAGDRFEFSNTCESTGSTYTLVVPGKNSGNVCEIYVKNPSWTNHDETKPSWRAQVKADYCVKALITEFQKKSCGNTPVFKINADAFYSTGTPVLK